MTGSACGNRLREFELGTYQLFVLTMYCLLKLNKKFWGTTKVDFVDDYLISIWLTSQSVPTYTNSNFMLSLNPCSPGIGSSQPTDLILLIRPRCASPYPHTHEEELMT